mgnify:CR=1 FL=1
MFQVQGTQIQVTYAGLDLSFRSMSTFQFIKRQGKTGGVGEGGGAGTERTSIYLQKLPRHDLP